MVDLAVAVLLVVIGAWIVVHEEMAGRGRYVLTLTRRSTGTQRPRMLAGTLSRRGLQSEVAASW